MAATVAVLALLVTAAPAGAILPPQAVGVLPNLAANCPTGLTLGSTGPCEYVPPPYPYYGPYGSEMGVDVAAKRMSNRLEAYIEKWMAHRASAKIPRSLIPDGILPQIGSFKLVRPNQVTPRQQWGIRTAFDFRPGVPYQYHGASPASYPDPHTTYFLNPAVFVPFGTKIIIHGEFPRSRFFDLQPSPSFDATYYREQSALGNQETPIVDADITPDACNVNPFRVWHGHRGYAAGCSQRGGGRAATTVAAALSQLNQQRNTGGRPHRTPGAVSRGGRSCAGWQDGDLLAPIRCRHYTVVLTAAMGNPNDLDRAATFPFREASNHRYMGPIQFQGPWGCDNTYKGVAGGLGCWDVGDIWGRYYAPDPPKRGHKADAFAGVGLPKITYELPDGRKFYIEADISALQKLNDIRGAPPTGPMRAPDAVEGPTEGWHMEFSILRVILEDVLRDSFGGEAPGLAVPDAFDPGGTGTRAKYVRDEDHGALGHDEALASPHNDEHGATEVPYINYLIRILAKETGHVVVVTGTLPTVPNTREGLKHMVAAQARYLSFTCYTPPLTSGTPEGNYSGSGGGTSFIGVPVWSVMDDQIQLDSHRHYALVLSAPADRPKNATNANHVTWMNYGPTPECHITLRWMSIAPQWYFAKSPTENHLGWATDLASLSYNPSLLNTNNSASTFLGQYQPVIHYMTTAQFDALGNHFDLTKVPAWKETVPGSGF